MTKTLDRKHTSIVSGISVFGPAPSNTATVTKEATPDSRRLFIDILEVDKTEIYTDLCIRCNKKLRPMQTLK